MMLYEGDVRRCRRCKRRRMDDEPPEVQQYKTCAKCRIIERTKKKLRKPLAEETMRYGMRQFQEQNQNANFIHDDIFASDLLVADMSAADVPMPLKQLYTQFAMYKQPLNHPLQAPTPPAYTYGYTGGAAPRYAALSALSAFQLPRIGLQTPYSRPTTLTAAGVAERVENGAMAPAPALGNTLTPTLASGAAPTPAMLASALAPTLAPTMGPSGPANTRPRYKAYPRGGRSRGRAPVPTHCELCSTKLDPEDTMSSVYRLCSGCYRDPYARAHVYGDFNDFLLEAVKAHHVPLAYVRELTPDLVELLNANRAILSEEQFRKVMLDLFGLIYVDPLMALLAPTKFTRVLHNVAEVNHCQPVVSKVSHQFHYTLTPPLRTSYVGSSDTATATIDLFFVAETNLIVIKQASKKNSAEYLAAFLRSLDAQMRARSLRWDDDPLKVYVTLQLSVDAEQFVRDWKSLPTQVAALREVPESNGAKKADEEDEEEGDGDDDEEEDDGEGDDGAPGDEEDEDDDDEDDEDDDDSADGEPDDLDPMFAP